LDGKILALVVLSGPSELVPGALEAVKQWQYRPSRLDGKPCYVTTRIDVDYALSPH